MADALAVLDTFGLERAWAIGHSWGGYLALHLLLAHPERLLGVICIDPLGAFTNTLAEQDANLRRGLSPQQIARLDEIEAKRRAGDVTEGELVERLALIWPQFFADPGRADESPLRVGVQASIGTNRSIAEHFARETLARRLPEAQLPALFVHGELDPMPPRSSFETAALIPHANVEVIPDCGHFPWIERPGALRHAVERFLTRTRSGAPQGPASS
jgi:proline iminopeptidase